MNYNYEMEQIIKGLDGKKKLLLHVCCAPCSSACIERLQDYFQISCYFYNPNIDSLDEYQKRLNELKRFLKEAHLDIDVVEDGYLSQDFLEMAKGLEEEKEGGKRCYACYMLRMKKTALKAKELGYDYFTTTLSISPYKNSTWLNEIGKDLEDKYKVNYLYADFKKKNGYKRSIELSNKYKLYRQNYCGCIYSKDSYLQKEN
ncbi:MAG: epoxyqueuosine reductase QueH [Bacilli bacterium]|nr:epoxyqueuosine reductase QueH [Bacilli bacterium]